MNKDTELRIPEKFRGVNPKHMRILEKMPQEEDLYRRKHVYYQRNFQFYKHALKLERNFITTKK
jgi:3-methyladenine DNA glycosylase AlkC